MTRSGSWREEKRRLGKLNMAQPQQKVTEAPNQSSAWGMILYVTSPASNTTDFEAQDLLLVDPKIKVIKSLRTGRTVSLHHYPLSTPTVQESTNIHIRKTNSRFELQKQ